jgi:shikimate kinase
MNKNIVLIGFMGAGKSSVAQQLGLKLSREVVATDKMITDIENKPIVDIFSNFGEDYFRALESKVVNDLARKENLIIDCGGGVVLRPANVALLRKNGVLFYLSASPEEIYERVKEQTHRPLLNTEDPQAKIKEILEKRLAFYEQAACYKIDTNGKEIDQICQEITEKISK